MMAAAMLTAAQIRQEIWRSRFGSALRTVVACSIVGCSTLYGPEQLRQIAAFPAFSYVTAILIVSDATFGDVLRGFWLVIYATTQMMVPSVLWLWLVGAGRFSNGLSAAAVAVIAFVVALPESTDLLAKRIAFGQIVIMFVGVVIHGKETGVFMLPVHVASSTALGAFASVLAMLLPYPKLAYYEIKKICRLYAKNISERLNLFVKAFSADNNTTAHDFISEAKSLTELGLKQLLSITEKQEGMLWERPQMRFMKPKYVDPGDKLHELEIPIKGMEMALTSCPSFPIAMVDQNLKDDLQSFKTQIGLKLQAAKFYASSDATTAPDIHTQYIIKPTIPSAEDFPAAFFLYCLQLLQNGLPENKSKTIPEESKRVWSSVLKVLPSKESLFFAVKCSLSLGLAVLFGLIYNKENGYWSGLTIAISFSNKRQATFAMANARVQGTAMGSIYGIIFAFLFQNAVNFRFLPLLPWIMITSLLRTSRMYGEAGGISAAIGASLILGRKNYGTPSEFGIARLAEATIGLICLVVIEILFRPTRAATLTKKQLSKSLSLVRNCIESIHLRTDLRDKQVKLESEIKVLDGFIEEAEMEPNFCFLPFRATSYRKVLESLSRMADLLLFIAYEIEFLSEASLRFGDQINLNLELIRKSVGSRMKCLEAMNYNVLQIKNMSQDIELGRSGTDIEEILKSFVELSREIAYSKEDEKLASQAIICLNGLAFCIRSLVKETEEVEKEVKEIVRWENSSDSDNGTLSGISCKANALIHTM